MKKGLLTTLVITAGVLLAGCNSSNGSEASNSGSTSSDPIKIVAVGSTALQPLVDTAKDQFVEDEPNYSISVQGGGSGTGLSQIADGAVTIGNSDVFAEEKSGIDASKLVDHKVAVVGMGPVANKDVGVTELTKEQLIEIFTGKVTNWKEVGGKDQEIAVINRPSGSGTRATFEKWGLDGAQAVKSQEQDSSGTVRQIVAQTPGAISYLAFSYMDDTTLALSLDGVEPKEENVADNSWPIWSYEHMYTNGEPDAGVKKFLDYMVSDDVQQTIVKELGYLPITDMKVERSVDGEVTKN
ncbi:phosphate ABC transporter substrate-binding protein PstS family protein [Enterococcus sp. CWB-B31]|uniref:phosphate ABC transporter substrate-binding protein PstS family protein n=1 Tax=Enterococcus sp. CWB-B31 TaxID=2885159 RepID=UPI001E2CCC94|nr:phosphate ABC transporter substrate-binding protein PstS family protein [Enterococcus sp. CWB-B31]MCB5955901.1 phosphate ABC transporter substrate-binding protein PstS family protein [Enterococcus sp. CWB-B31]